MLGPHPILNVQKCEVFVVDRVSAQRQAREELRERGRVGWFPGTEQYTITVQYQTHFFCRMERGLSTLSLGTVTTPCVSNLL